MIGWLAQSPERTVSRAQGHRTSSGNHYPRLQPVDRGAVARLLSHDQLVRLESALELYRTEHGEYPMTLRALLDGQIVTEQDLRYPYRESYYYRRTQTGFVLLPPLD